VRASETRPDAAAATVMFHQLTADPMEPWMFAGSVIGMVIDLTRRGLTARSIIEHFADLASSFPAGTVREVSLGGRGLRLFQTGIPEDSPGSGWPIKYGTHFVQPECALPGPPTNSRALQGIPRLLPPSGYQ
jgi:hypothetical protein